MFRNLLQALTLVSISLLWLSISASTVFNQQLIKNKDTSSQTIISIGDYTITVKDLDQIISTYPAGSVSSPEAKRRLVESLVTTKLFALAARDAKMDATEDFKKAREKARGDVLIYSYVQRNVKPKFSEEEARKYFEAHKQEYGNFEFYRSQIMDLLRDQALTQTNEALMQEFNVKQRDDLLKDLDLRNAKDLSMALAQIGPAVVTVGDVKELANLYPGQNFSTLAAKKELLDILVLERLYRVAAERAGLVNDPEVRKALERADDQLLAGQYVRLVEGKVTMEDARRYYQAHAEEFKQPDQVRLRQIVVVTPEEAQAIKAKLNRGEAFEEVAKTSSADQSSAARGGDIGWVRKGRLHPEVEKVAFQLKPKQVSEPIKMPDGYSIVRLEERLEGKVRPFEEVSANILMQMKTSAIEAERKRLMAVYKVSINEKLL